MTQPIGDYIDENGIEPVFEFLRKFKNDNKEFHEFAQDNNIEMDSWFEFGWMINDYLSPGRGGDVLPLVSFNYVAVENTAKEILEQEEAIEWETLINKVSEQVETATVTDVSKWFQFFDIETLDDDFDTVTNINFD